MKKLYNGVLCNAKIAFRHLRCAAKKGNKGSCASGAYAGGSTAGQKS